ncbi:hypothetical protein FHS78_001907 [Parvibaculum indicum]|nr:hypothetical protein [Parvibaculum indicum]
MATGTAVTIIVNTANTMSTRGTQISTSDLTRLPVAAFVLLVSMVLIVLSLPRIIAAGQTLPVRDEAQAIANGDGAASPLALARSVKAYSRAAWWMPGDARMQETLARLYIAEANKYAGAGREIDDLQMALTHMDASLRHAPNRTFGWALRAETLRRLNEPVKEIERALHLSYLLGPREASAMLLRAGVILDIWGATNSNIHDIAENDLMELWASPRSRVSLAQLYLRKPLGGRLRLRRLILSSPEDVAKFNTLVKSVHNRS